MKKIIPIMALSLALVGCTNTNSTESETNTETNTNETQVSENTDDTQVIDVEKAENNKENSEESGSVETEDQNEEDSEVSQKKDQEDKEEENSDDASKKESEEENQAENEGKEVSKDDLFFSLYAPFSTVNENGDIVDESGNVAPSDESYNYDYVKYSNNLFVRSKRNVKDLKDIVAIVRMNDKDVTTLYEFPQNEDFRPLGLIGDKVYGYHNYNEDDEINGTPTLKQVKSAIGYVDLATGEVKDFDATVDGLVGGAVVVDGELQFTLPGDNNEQNAYNFDLYKLDLSKGTDQEAELLEKDFDLQYLFGQKRFENGNPVWKIYRADNENIYVNDQKFPFLWAEQGNQEIIGNNIFYFNNDGISEDRLSRTIKVINMSSGETVLETQIRGMKIEGNKLYYLTPDNEVESVDIEL
ncbi:hypothetical protein [Anaerococcus sp. Marseille-Q5996]|uniref:hypothetical protein n=1 Tax=Anaerococcus sp. Marseille-Q5996 TaxID=2972769 RepID=UPI0021C8C20F|nr:hypothetical protein [Anaerococcus sp. Marseille-Q5996]